MKKRPCVDCVLSVNEVSHPNGHDDGLYLRQTGSDVLVRATED